MTFARIRVAFCSPCRSARRRRTRPPDRPRRRAAKRPRHRSPPTRSRSRCRSTRRSPSARCRTACATTCGRTPKPARRAELRLVVKAGSVLEDDDQLGLAHFVEHMQFEGTRNFPRQGLTEFLASLGVEHRRGRQRADELRRHAVHAARADRRARRARSRAAGAGGLGARRDVRPGRHRAPARHRPLRVADEPRRRRADRRQGPARAARGIALCGPVADRQARDHRARAARAAACASIATGIVRT